MDFKEFTAEHTPAYCYLMSVTEDYLTGVNFYGNSEEGANLL